MLYRGLLATNYSGAIDGLIAAHNAGGSYFRSRATPTNPNTSRQIYMRTAIAAAYVAWTGLDASQRAVWEQYARSIARTNRIGETKHHSGWNEYVRAYTYRKYAESQFPTGIDTNPATIALPQPAFGSNIPSGTSTIGQTTAHIYYNLSPTDESDYETLVMCEVSGVRSSPGTITITPYPATKNFFAGPWQLAGVNRTGYGPPYNEIVVNLSRAIAANERLWFRLRISSLARGLGSPYYGVITSEP